jgi:hypothetical protein
MVKKLAPQGDSSVVAQEKAYLQRVSSNRPKGGDVELF